MSLNNDEECEETHDEEFTKPTEFTDIILNVEGKQLHAVRFVLITSSPVFKTMITSPHFKESNDKEISFPSDNFRDMQLMLKYINPDVGVLTANLSEILLPLADKYQMEGLKKRCIKCLFSDLKEIPNERLVSLLSITEQLGLEKLKEECVKLLVKRPTNELAKYINNADPKATVTWQSVTKILKPFSDRISKQTRLVDSVKELATKHAGSCDHHMCFVDASDEFDSVNNINKFGTYWHDQCLRRFACDTLYCFNLT